MSSMFYGCTSFTGRDGLKWGVNGVLDVSFMFYGAASFVADLETWRVYKVEDMSAMFE